MPVEKFFHVPNGYDSADYLLPEQIDQTLYNPDKFIMTYTGSMYGRRNPAALFLALESLIEKGLIKKESILLRFIGRFGNEIHDMFQSSSLKDSIEIIGYIPHEKSISYVQVSDVLLLIVDESKESEEIVPGKVYEYIGSMKPVLAIAPEQGAIADLIKETQAGGIAHQSNIEGIASIIFEMYSAFKKGLPLANPHKEIIQCYERRESTKKLAELLDGKY